MNGGLFITGTGTGVGKTVVAAGLLRSFVAGGIDAVPMKPVQTGAVAVEGGLRAGDLDYSLAAAGLEPEFEEFELMSPYRYEPACSPHLAGRLAGSYPEIARILSSLEKLRARHEFIIVEGAGGVLVPLNESETMLGLMKTIGFGVLLVADAGLGTINHTLLSLAALRGAEIEVAAVVLNNLSPEAPDDAEIREDNLRTIARLGEVETFSLKHLGVIAAPGDADWTAFNDSLHGLLEKLKGATR